jgi:hypothetical protein
LRHPLGALGEELEVGIGVNVENVDELGLEQGADVHPFLVNLLHSATRGKQNDGSAVPKGRTIPFMHLTRVANPE